MVKKILLAGFGIEGLSILLLLIYIWLGWVSEFTILLVLGMLFLGAMVNLVGLLVYALEKYKELEEKHNKQ